MQLQQGMCRSRRRAPTLGQEGPVEARREEASIRTVLVYDVAAVELRAWPPRARPDPSLAATGPPGPEPGPTAQPEARIGVTGSDLPSRHAAALVTSDLGPGIPAMSVSGGPRNDKTAGRDPASRAGTGTAQNLFCVAPLYGLYLGCKEDSRLDSAGFLPQN